MENFINKYKKPIGGLLFLIVSIIYLVNVSKIVNRSSGYYNSQFLPSILGWSLLILSVIEIVRGLIVMIGEGRDRTDKESVVLNSSNGKKVLYSILLMVMFVFLMKRIGFIVISIVYLILQILVFVPEKNRNMKKILLIACVFTILIEIVFYYLLNIIIPQGLIQL
jgi:hypothetical protein